MTQRAAMNLLPSVKWISHDGMPLACQDKVKTLNDTLGEIRELCQYALEDAVLMGCSEHCVRTVFGDVIAGLKTSLASAVQWIGRDGMPVACQEKVKVLNDNLNEIRELCQYIMQSAVAMGCGEHFIRMVLSDVVAGLKTPYAKSA